MNHISHHLGKQYVAPKQAFTLIELLVVIAIIAILASLLIPGINKARDTGKKSACAGNMKQIGAAISLYMADNDGHYPTHMSPAGPVGYEPHRSWDDNLSPYDGRNLSDSEKNANLLQPSAGYDSHIYKCPDDDVKRYYGSDPNCLPISYAPTWHYRHNYVRRHPRNNLGVTGYYWQPAGGGKPAADPVVALETLNIGTIKYPSRTIAVFESTLVGSNMGRFYCGSGNANTQYSNPAYVPHESLSGSNYLMVDGHVEYLTFNDTLELVHPPASLPYTTSPTELMYTRWDGIRTEYQ